MNNKYDEITSSLNSSDELLSFKIKERLDRISNRPTILEVKNLNKIFDNKNIEKTVLNNINIKVNKREFICIVGPSGCGKSTLIRTLAGLEPASSGTILVDGKPIIGPGPDRGMVFQSYTLFPWLTVKKNIMFGLLESGMSKDAANTHALQWVELVGLSEFINHYPHQLSGGMKQRVAIARALANQPKILLMDEPFGALDPNTRLKMQNHLMEIWQNIDITIIFITHDLDEAIYLSDRIILLKSNPGEVDEIINVPLDQPRHPNQLNTDIFLRTKRYLEKRIHNNQDQKESIYQPLDMVTMVHKDSDVPTVF